MWVLPDVSAVAAEQFGVCRPERAPLPDDHQLHLTLVDVHQHRGAPLRVHEEEDGEQGHLKLRAGPDEGAADGLHHTVPAELQVQNVVVLIGLQAEPEMSCENLLAWREKQSSCVGLTKSCSLALYPL